jgi:hypothetical protein
MREKEKICNKCGKIKPLDEFHKQPNGRFGVMTYCKKCVSQKRKIYWQLNKEEINKRRKISRKKYYEKNFYSISEYNKKYRIKNRGKINEHTKIYRQNNPRYRLCCSMSSFIYRSIKNKKNGMSWEKILGYSRKDLIKYLESKFKYGMSWNNYGRGGWHIDHIIPKSLWKFNSYNDREFKQCYSLANLQPLWEWENYLKRNRV